MDNGKHKTYFYSPSLSSNPSFCPVVFFLSLAMNSSPSFLILGISVCCFPGILTQFAITFAITQAF